MKKLSLKYGLGLAVLATLVVTIPCSLARAAQKPTLLRGARTAPEGSTQRMYFESSSQDEGKLRTLRADLIAALVKDGGFRSVEDGLTIHIREKAPDGRFLGIFVNDDRKPSESLQYIAKSGVLLENDQGSFLDSYE